MTDGMECFIISRRRAGVFREVSMYIIHDWFFTSSKLACLSSVEYVLEDEGQDDQIRTKQTRCLADEGPGM